MGKIVEIQRGAKRAFMSIVIEVGEEDHVNFPSYSGKEIQTLTPEEIKELLLESGLWPSLRVRPFGKVANPKTNPNAIFVNLMDTNPLAPNPKIFIDSHKDALFNGIEVLSKLTSGKLFVCKEKDLVLENLPDRVVVEEFQGPHPAGNVGTHIHFLYPVNDKRFVWHVGYQEAIAIGYLFTTGKIFTERVISLAGPVVKAPRLIQTRVGASIDEIVEGQLKEGENRVISGSVLSGRKAIESLNFLGYYDYQISAIEEGRKREFMGWMLPGFNKFSFQKIFASCFLGKKNFSFTSSRNGSLRAIVPIGAYEKVVPMDILPTILFRSLLANDLEKSIELGCLELVEEDLALCSFVSHSKIDYGEALRNMLTSIEKEGL